MPASLPDPDGAWNAAVLRAWTERIRAERLVLQWSVLEGIDAAHPSRRMSPGGNVAIMLTLGLPGLILSPILYPLTLLAEGDLPAQKRALFAAALAVASGATPAEVAARAGEPEEWHRFTIASVPWLVTDYRCRHWNINGSGARFAFRDGHLVWVRTDDFLPQFQPPSHADPAATPPPTATRADSGPH